MFIGRTSVRGALLVASLLCGASLHAQSVWIESGGGVLPSGAVMTGQQDYAALDIYIEVTAGTVAFTGLDVLLTGSAVPGDFTGFDLLRDNDISYSVSAGDSLVASGNLAGGVVSFTGFNLNVAGIPFYLVSADVSAGATQGHTFQLSTQQSGFTFNPGSTAVSGSSYSGPWQTISNTGAPVMEVEEEYWFGIPHGSTHVAYNAWLKGRSYDFRIENYGSATLQLVGAPVVISSPVNCSVTPSQPPNSTIVAGDGVPFSLWINPNTLGAFSFVVTIDNDSAQNPYAFTVTGTAVKDTSGGSGSGERGLFGCSTGPSGSAWLLPAILLVALALVARRRCGSNERTTILGNEIRRHSR